METSSPAMEKEHKEDDHADAWPPSSAHHASERVAAPGAIPPKVPNKLSMVKALLGECLCEPFQFAGGRGLGPSTQFVELHGIRFIGLGAVMDELTPRERVYDTLEQLTTRTERLISIGYLLDGDPPSPSTDSKAPAVDVRKVTETIPLDVWNRNYPNDHSMSRQIKQTVDRIKKKEFAAVTEELSKLLATQKATPNRGNNKYMAGITAHNLGVVKVIAGEDDKAVPVFQEAIALKEAGFGPDHTEVALSWDELGTQLFARGDFEESLAAFREAHKIRNKQDGHSFHPSVAMVLNNIACCNYQMHNHRTAMLTLQKAREIQQKAIGSSAQADLDLLHVAIVIGNCGYVMLALKQYDEARSLLEEALLIQQSVLDDNHRAVRDTLSNMEFTNAFHS